MTGSNGAMRDLARLWRKPEPALVTQRGGGAPASPEPANSSRSVPAPSCARRIRDAALAQGATYGVAQAARDVDWSGLVDERGAAVEFSVPVTRKMPELGYGIFTNARIAGRSSYPITSDDALLIDGVNVNERSKYRTYSRPLTLKRAQPLDGETINLGSVFATTNYGHALLDGLGRLGLLAQAGYDLGNAARVVIPAFPSKTIMRLVELAGFSGDRIVVPETGAHFVCERLVQTTFPGRPRVYSDAPVQFMRSLAIEPAGNARRLLLLRRGDKRAIVNGDEVAALADEFDLEIYDPLASEFSPADFGAAELVVGAHGAGLADLGFCAPGTRAIELLPSGHRYPYFATLAGSAGLDYTAFACASVTVEPHSDFTVDVGALRRLLDATR